MLAIRLFTFSLFFSQPVPAAEPTASWDQGLTRAALEDQLARDVTDLTEDETLRLSVGSLGCGLIQWDVYYDQENLLAALDRRGFEPQTETKRRLLDWADALNRELFNRTQNAIRSAGHEEDGDLEADFSSSFYRSDKEYKLQGGTGTFSFRGTRRLPEGLAYDSTSPVAGSSQVSNSRLLLDMVIHPAKSDWAYREPITGHCEMTNRGSGRISIELDNFGGVTVREAAGNPARNIERKVSYCGGVRGRESPIVLRPGESTTRPFAFETDTLSTLGGYELGPGTYSLGWTDLNPWLNIPCTIHPAMVTVLQPSPAQRLARIVEFAAARNRLLITRETGLVEAFNLQTGKRVARTKIADFVRHEIWNRAVVVSPDGSLIAYVHPRRAWSDESGVIELHSIDKSDARPRLLNIPRKRGYDLHLLRFSIDGRSLFLRDDTLEIVRVADSSVIWKDPSRSCIHAWLSPDGRYLVRSNYQDTIWQSSVSNPLDAKAVASVGQDICAGLGGWYAINHPAKQVSFHSYDSEPGWTIECPASQILESPDGRYLAVTTYSADEASRKPQTEIWSTSPARKLFELPGEPDLQFAAAPARIIVGSRLTRWSLGRIEPYEPRFEVLDPDSGVVLSTISIPPSNP